MFLSLACITLPLSAQTSNPNLLPPLAPAYGEMRPSLWEQHGTAVLIAIPILIALAALAGWLILRPRPLVIVSPEALARDSLEKLRRQPENGNVLSEISQALRRCVMAVFECPSAELTTTEFSAALAGSEKVGPELAQAISGFLRECDEAKFSPASSATPLNAAARALELVEQVGRRRAAQTTPLRPCPSPTHEQRI
jgi:hypothetical protein